MEYNFKEGEKVWIPNYKTTGRIARHPKTDELCVIYYDGNAYVWDSLKVLSQSNVEPLNMEPYALQDIQEKFQRRNKWFKLGKQIVCTTGNVEGYKFKAFNINCSGIIDFDIRDNWISLTDEEVNQIQRHIGKLTNYA